MSDLISREEILKLQYKIADSATLSARNVINAEDVEEMPSAERTGYWVCTSSDHYKCSNCGTRASYWYNEENSCEWDKDMSEWLSDYCPNCGARMVSEDDSERSD